MTSEKVSLAQVAETLEALRQEVSRLGQRLELLESSAGTKPRAAGAGVASAALAASPAPAVPTTPPSIPTSLDEETVTVIAAAIAAFLGKKAHIRQIQLLGSSAWIQQGRVTIQASHALSAHHR